MMCRVMKAVRFACGNVVFLWHVLHAHGDCGMLNNGKWDRCILCMNRWRKYHPFFKTVQRLRRLFKACIGHARQYRRSDGRSADTMRL